MEVSTIFLGTEGIEAAGLGDSLSIFRKPMSQIRIALSRLVVPDPYGQGPFGTHHDHQFLSPGIAVFFVGIGDSFDLALEIGEHGLKPDLLAVMGILIP